MSETKYRAWNIALKEMWWGFYIQSDSGNVWLENEDGDMQECTEKDFILMQYSPFKDIDDEEICKGDIVEVNGGGTNTLISEVGFEKGCFVLYPDWLKSHTDNKPRWVELYRYCNFRTDIMTIKIIGNIYENPELLKKE